MQYNIIYNYCAMLPTILALLTRYTAPQPLIFYVTVSGVTCPPHKLVAVVVTLIHHIPFVTRAAWSTSSDDSTSHCGELYVILNDFSDTLLPPFNASPIYIAPQLSSFHPKTSFKDETNTNCLYFRSLVFNFNRYPAT